MEVNMDISIQNTCPATWVNSSIVPNQSPFQAEPIPAPIGKIEEMRDIAERSVLLISRITKSSRSTPAPLAFSAVLVKGGQYVAEAMVEAAKIAPVETFIAGVSALTVVVFLVIQVDCMKSLLTGQCVVFVL
jgi:hypothetical protein